MTLAILLALLLPAASSAAEFSLPALSFPQVVRLPTPQDYEPPTGRPLDGKIHSLQETVEKMRHSISVAPELNIRDLQEMADWITVATGGDFWHTREALGVLLAEKHSPFVREALLLAVKNLSGITLRAAIYPGAVGEEVSLILRVKNIGATDLSIIKPVDGSAEGLRYPHYRAWVRRHDEDFVPLQDGRPAGPQARLRDSDIVLLRPGRAPIPTGTPPARTPALLAADPRRLALPFRDGRLHRQNTRGLSSRQGGLSRSLRQHARAGREEDLV